MKANLIERPYYTEKIRPYIRQPIIKILTGQRRIGKSYILQQFANIIRREDKQANIIYVNKELKEYGHIATDDDLYEYIKTKYTKRKNNYVFIDEIQEIPGFQHTLRSLLAEGECDLYCTGSNANMLSGELATLLAGRYMEFSVHCLSYKEFLDFHGYGKGNESLQKYLQIGGMPYLIHLKDEQLCFDYLQNLYSTILLKDVISRKQIRDVNFMTDLVHFLADNVGSLFSATSISKYLKSQRQQLPTQMVIEYTAALCQAYFIHKAERAEIAGLKIFESGEKYFFEDLGIRNAIRGYNPKRDIQKYMENVIYLHLKRNGYRVFVGKTGNLEVDFAGIRMHEKIYIQSAFRLELDQTKTREIASLMKIKDSFPKYIVTLDDYAGGIDEYGIRTVKLGDFLLTDL